MNEFATELSAFISKSSALIAAIAVGVVAKISTEILMKRKLNMLQWMGIVGISVFFGYLTAVYCSNNDMENQGKWLVPLSTLFGEKIMIYLTTHYKSILHKIINPTQK
jgi:intracellular septation protein A